MHRDTVQTIKEIAHNIGFGAAPLAVTTGNSVANLITVMSAFMLIIPKLFECFNLLKSIKTKKHAPKTETN